jgi:ATP-dependent Clp protease adaptor protein ClpS
MGTKERIETEIDQETKPPVMYKVILLNDDFTSMEFVVQVLMQLFHHSQESAVEIMLNIHKKGRGVCGVFTREIAETKVAQVHQLAKSHAYPLRATIEEE